MDNSQLLTMTKEIIISLASTSSQFHADEKSANEVVKAMDIIYNKLVELNSK